MSDHEEDTMLRISATHDATSELGCTRAEENTENGAMTSRCDENLLRTLLAAQNQNMMSLIEAIKGPAGCSSGSGAAPAAAVSSERRVDICHVSNPSGVLINTGATPEDGC